MILKNWEKLPDNMKNDSVRYYYNIIHKRKYSLITKRIFDVVFSIIILLLFLPLFLFLSLAIKFDSKGPVIYKQVRVTQYGKQFKILKFRTMINNAEKLGSDVTISNDTRITRVGRIIRKLRMDEFPQLINILVGDMSFIGTRPEIVKYVERYTNEMMATLLLPAGVTSETSIQFKNEMSLISNIDDVDKIYICEILPEKMKYNLMSLENFNFLSDVKIFIKTIKVFLGKN